jgi:putative DNA primase/helicase
MLKNQSAINDDVISQRGYVSIITPQEAQNLGFSTRQSYAVSEKYPALIIPYYGTDGRQITCCMRPDNPRSIDDKDKGKLPDGTYPQKTFKYEMVKGAGNVLDCHPATSKNLQNPEVDLIFTEGAKKADSLISQGFTAINLNGVWGWRGTNKQQGKTALSGFDDIALNGRRCILLFDSDVRTNEHVKSALRRFKAFLENRGAKVFPVLLPPDGPKGIDDWFATGKSAEDLRQLISYFEVFQPDLGSSQKKWTTELYADLFRDWGYRFAINDLNESIEVGGKLLDDTKMDIIEARLMDENIPVGHARKAITVIANVNRYHPIKDYLRNLKWDGHPHMELFTTFFEDKDGIFPVLMKRWFIGVVAKVMSDGEKQNFLLALDGQQGIGKSHVAKWLCPLKNYFLESPLNPDDKDSRLNLMNYWIWEIGELGSVTRRSDREALKRTITTRIVVERPPYARRPVEKPAITSFIGTVNNEAGFLNDPTGNRRFAACTITKIDWDYIKLDVNQIWAEATYLYQNGEPHTFTELEECLRNQINLRYIVEEPLEAMVMAKLIIDPTQTSNPNWALTSARILELMELKPEDRGLVMRLTTTLKDLGLEKDEDKTTVNGQRGRFWRGIRQK